MKIKWFIWGTGVRAKENLYWLKKITPYISKFEILGFIDSAIEKQNGSFEGFPVYAPDILTEIDFDYVAIWSTFETEIKEQLVSYVKACKISNIFMEWIEKLYVHHKNDGNDILNFVDHIKKSNKLAIYYNTPQQKQATYWEAEYDSRANLHYVNFFGKKMYLKRDYPFIKRGEQKLVPNLWKEQDPSSPHLYVKQLNEIQEGDIIVDAGACEGNFTLFHIEQIKKAYLIECDAAWIEALSYTFEPYKEKIVFCNKFLSSEGKENTITIDQLVQGETINFLKMDIEGEEENALQGAKRAIRESDNFRCAICAYHKREAKDNIMKILNELALTELEVSDGYMLFLHDEEVIKYPELRNGIIRGAKRCIT